jgi:predicted nucleic acid-binding Zn ribbon protein
MPNYYYTCPSCGHKYNENRLPGEDQFFTKCNACGQADYVENE